MSSGRGGSLPRFRKKSDSFLPKSEGGTIFATDGILFHPGEADVASNTNDHSEWIFRGRLRDVGTGSRGVPLALPVLEHAIGYATTMKTQHRKRVRHFEETCDFHEWTFSCYRRRPLLTNDPWRRILARSIDASASAEAFSLIAFVFMPEHAHRLVLPTSNESKVSRFLARLKQPTSSQIKRIKRIEKILVEHGSPLVKQLAV